MKTFYQLSESIKDKIGDFTGDNFQAQMARDISQEENLPYSDVRDYFCDKIISLINEMIDIIQSMEDTNLLRKVSYGSTHPRIIFLAALFDIRTDLKTNNERYFKQPQFANDIKKSFQNLFAKFNHWLDWTSDDKSQIVPLMNEFKQWSKKLFLSGVKQTFSQYTSVDFAKWLKELKTRKDITDNKKGILFLMTPNNINPNTFNFFLRNLEIDNLSPRTKFLINQIKNAISKV